MCSLLAGVFAKKEVANLERIFVANSITTPRLSRLDGIPVKWPYEAVTDRRPGGRAERRSVDAVKEDVKTALSGDTRLAVVTAERGRRTLD